MTAAQLAGIQRKFERYAREYAGAGKALHPLLQLKQDHSRRVAAEARELSSDLDWPAAGQRAATALGQLHDIGRFAQFAQQRHFSDAAAVDHGEHGWQTVAKLAWLEDLSAPEQDAILTGIRYHNRRAIPADVSAAALPFLRLVRDADKLDIFRVVLEGLERDGFQDLPGMLPGINLDRTASPQILVEIRAVQSASLQAVRTMGDFLLLLLSWVYDLNYSATARKVLERNILSRLLEQVAANPGITALVDDLQCVAAGRRDAADPPGPKL